MTEFGGMKVSRGSRLQAGIPFSSGSGGDRAAAVLLRGAVTATYVSDDPNHPQAENDKAPPIGVYCDVLIYSGPPGARWFGLTKVMVLQPQGGLYSGHIWKPRATTCNLLGTLDPNTTNPAVLDGDHVLVGFMDACLQLPVILGGIPHPSQDFGQEDTDLGVRLRLKLEDGDPNLWRHHGTVWGADKLGSFRVDTSRANDGKLEEGKEPAPPTEAGKGDQTYTLPQEAIYRVLFQDMADPATPVEVAHFRLDKVTGELSIKDVAGIFQILVGEGQTIKIEGKDAGAKLTLGNGSHAVAIAEHLQALYNSLKTKLDGFDSHVHPTGMGPSGTPTPLIGCPAWDTTINSQKLTLPDG